MLGMLAAFRLQVQTTVIGWKPWF